MKKTASFLDSTLASIQRLICVISILGLIGLFAVSITLRYFLKMDVFGLEELIQLPSFWLYFVSAGFAARSEGTHISTEVLSSYITNERFNKFLNIIISAVSLAILAIMFYWSIELVQRSYLQGATTHSLRIPKLAMDSSICAGFFFLTVYYIKHFINNIVVFFNKKA